MALNYTIFINCYYSYFLCSTVLSSSHQHHRAGHGLQPPHHSNRLQPEREQPNQLSTQAMYSNLIPALFFPAQMANNQKPTGGYIAVSMPTSFNQQPFQLLQVCNFYVKSKQIKRKRKCFKVVKIFFENITWNWYIF